MTGKLGPLWGKVGGRDKLAEITGISPGTLSGYNTGRLRLGMENAPKLAEALKVSVFELGGPLHADNGESSDALRDVVREEVEAALREVQFPEMLPRLEALAKAVARIEKALGQPPQERRRSG